MIGHQYVGWTENAFTGRSVEQEFTKVEMEGSIQPTRGASFQGNGPMHHGEGLI
jgi:hypothetical protein